MEPTGQTPEGTHYWCRRCQLRWLVCADRGEWAGMDPAEVLRAARRKRPLGLRRTTIH